MEAARPAGTFVVVGGGIAGVTCAEQVCRAPPLLDPRSLVTGGCGRTASRVALPALRHAPSAAQRVGMLRRALLERFGDRAELKVPD